MKNVDVSNIAKVQDWLAKQTTRVYVTGLTIPGVPFERVNTSLNWLRICKVLHFEGNKKKYQRYIVFHPEYDTRRMHRTFQTSGWIRNHGRRVLPLRNHINSITQFWGC